MVNQCHECQDEWSVALMSVCVCVCGGGSVVVIRSGQEWSVAVMIVMRGGQSLL